MKIPSVSSLTIQQILIFLLFCVSSVAYAQTGAPPPFLLRFIDSANGRPVPLVDVELFNALRLSSDNLGHIAINEPDLTGRKVRLLIRGHGYRYPHLDIFRERAIGLEIKPGETAEIKLERTVAGERLYRITGSGRFRDSLLAGKISGSGYNDLPGNATGLDSAIPVWWKNRLFCFWGDTLGTDRINLCGSGGQIMTESPDVPEKALPISFFCARSGFTKPMIKPDAIGFIWIETVLPLLTATGREVLAARYVKHKTLEEAVETGFAIFQPGRQQFSLIKRLKSSRPHKSAHAAPVYDSARPAFCVQPWEKTDTSLSNFINPHTYEYYTCLQPASKNATAKNVAFEGRPQVVRRNGAGQPVFSWVKGGVPFSPANQRLLQAAGLIKPSERWLELTEIGSGTKNTDFSGSISWNSFRKRWVMIAQGNTGEIWFSEADTYTGPWIYARRIVEHDGYNFYNPVHHSWFDTNEGRTIYFEGTYTSFFTRENYKTPRADYNQVMYRLDITNPDLILPVPVYRVRLPLNGWRLMTRSSIEDRNLWKQIEKIEFLAFENNPGNSPHLQPVFDHAGNDALQSDLSLTPNGLQPVFFTLKSNEMAFSEMKFARELAANPTQIGTVFKNTSSCLTLDPDIRPR